MAESRGEYSIAAGSRTWGERVQMKIVVGLGNPGRNYAGTRHNLGFMVVDRLARVVEAGEGRGRFQSAITEGRLNGEKIVLVKPQTYMNLSGNAVREIINWYHAAAGDLLIVLDDLDLAYSTIRLRGNGSAGGHNGLYSVIEQLGTSEIPRLRIGIGRGQGAARTQVLSRFTEEELHDLPAMIEAASECARLWIADGLIAAMNQCNRRELVEPAPSPTASEMPS